MPFKPGQSGNPAGKPPGTKSKHTKKLDEAFDLAFEAMQSDDKTSLHAWAKENPTEFYKLYARKLTTSADNHNHNVSETVSQEQARTMAEAFIESTRGRMGEGEPDRLHGGVSPGLQGESPAPQDCSSTGAGGAGRDTETDDLRPAEARQVDADFRALSGVVSGAES